MGSDKREAESKGLRHPRKADSTGGGADWGEVDGKVIVDVIQKASKKGGAVRFGYTRDGGAYAIGVYAGGDYFTDYVRPSEDVTAYLRDLAESFEEYTPDSGKPVERRAKR